MALSSRMSSTTFLIARTSWSTTASGTATSGQLQQRARVRVGADDVTRPTTLLPSASVVARNSLGGDAGGEGEW